MEEWAKAWAIEGLIGCASTRREVEKRLGRGLLRMTGSLCETNALYPCLYHQNVYAWPAEPSSLPESLDKVRWYILWILNTDYPSYLNELVKVIISLGSQTHRPFSSKNRSSSSSLYAAISRTEGFRGIVISSFAITPTGAGCK